MNHREQLIAILQDAGVVFEEGEHEGTKHLIVADDPGPKNNGYTGFITRIVFDADGQITEWGAWE